MAKTDTLFVRKQCGEHCIALEDAENLFKQLTILLEAGENVTLDFEGVETIASSFLNVAMGRLVGIFKPEFLKQNLKWTGVDDVDNQLIALVMRNAKEHYGQDAQSRMQRDKIVKTLSEG